MDTKATWSQLALRSSKQQSDEAQSVSSLEADPQADAEHRRGDIEFQTGEEDIEFVVLDVDKVAAWIEAQLLDCQNLARQHGLTQVADILDTALDQLEHEVAAKLDDEAGDEFSAAGWVGSSATGRGLRVKLC